MESLACSLFPKFLRSCL